MANTRKLLKRRAARSRGKLNKADNQRLRLSVFRSGRHIYAQLIDDTVGATMASASTLDKELRKSIKSGCTQSAAAEVGTLLAQRAVAQDLKNVKFDRGGYQYHGRVKALADAARQGGLKF